jgi:hypothetical protein
MRFNRVSGFEDPVGERVVIFSSEVEQCGAHVVVIGGEGLETATQISAIESIIPSVGLGTTDLIDGATYNITIEYQDCGGHTKSVSSPNTVTYAGITTLPPVLTRPGTRASIPREFYFEFELPEVPCPTEKVTITFLRSGGLIQDSFQGTRTVQLDIATGGLHIFKMTDLSNAASLSQVSSVIPATDLVHGSKYLVDIFYQDAVCNPIQTAGSVEVTFAGNFTLAPIFYFPASSTVLSQTFNIKFVFVEAGLQNSTTITFTPLVPDSSPPPNVCGYATTDSLSHVLMLDDFSEGIQDFCQDSRLDCLPPWCMAKYQCLW